MEQLARFIRTCGGEIIAQWEGFAGALEPARRLAREHLRNDVPQILTELARSVEHGEEGGTNALGALVVQHASTRTTAGYDIREIAAEYAALRAAIVLVYARHAPELAARLEPLVVLNRVIDHGIGEALEHCAQERDRELRAFTEERERYIGILGHDLRTPLGSVIMASQLLAQTASAGQRELVARIDRSARRMERLIGDVLTFARAHLGGSIPVLPEPVDLGEICRDIVDEVSVAHPDRRVVLHQRGDLRGRWDRARVSQALSNLIANAIQHGGDPVVIFASSDCQDAVITEVRNRGSLADTEQLDQLVHAPHQAPFAPGRRGLGLSIVTDIVRAHRGSIEVRFCDGRTIVTVRWPRS